MPLMKTPPPPLPRLPGDFQSKYIVVNSRSPAEDRSRFTRFISALEDNPALEKYLKYPLEETKTTQNTKWWRKSDKESKSISDLNSLWNKHRHAMRLFTDCNRSLYEDPTKRPVVSSRITVAFTNDTEFVKWCNEGSTHHWLASNLIQNMMDTEDKGTVGKSTWFECMSGNISYYSTYVTKPVSFVLNATKDFVQNEIYSAFGWEMEDTVSSVVDEIRSKSWCAPSMTVDSMEDISAAWWNGTQRRTLSGRDREWHEPESSSQHSAPTAPVSQSNLANRGRTRRRYWPFRSSRTQTSAKLPPVSQVPVN